MKLNKLQIGRFKGAAGVNLEPEGANLVIYGDNAVGKTTLADAFYWLLFGKDSQNRADFEIKTLGADGTTTPKLDYSVNGSFTLGSGDRIDLQKIYREVWTTPRGQSALRFDGHETDHKINGVPVTKGEYTTRIAQICDEKKFRLLADPMYFNEQMKWQDRRVMLLDSCGDVSQADVIASSIDLHALTRLLGNHTPDELRKITEARRKEVNEQRKGISPRIDELTRIMEQTPAEPSLKEVEHFRWQLRALTEQKARMQAGGEVAQVKLEIAEVDAEIAKSASESRATWQDCRNELVTAVNFAAGAQMETEVRLTGVFGKLKEIAASAQRIEAQLTGLRSEYQAISQTVFTPPATEDCCPTCGQSLPASQIAEAIQKAQDIFNTDKSTRLERNQSDGRAIKLELGKCSEEIQKLEQDREQISAELAEKQAVLHDASAKLAEFDKTPFVPQPSAELQSKREELVARLDRLGASMAEEIAKVDTGIAEAQAQIETAEQEIAAQARRTDAARRIEELRKEEETLADLLGECDGTLFLLDMFTRAKVEMLEEKINSRFQIARFKLFNALVNGGIEECCEATYAGVPFSSLNHGMRVNVGLDIINTLAETASFTPPIFIDGAESVTTIIPTRGQQIKLVVSASDKTLRVETAQAQLKEAI